MLRFVRLGGPTLYFGEPTDSSSGGHLGQCLFVLPAQTPMPSSSPSLDQAWDFQHQPLAAEYGMRLITSDVLRKELASVEPDSRQQHAYRAGMYSKSFTSKTYRELLRRACADLEAGRSVVLDATFSARQWRDAAVNLAADAGALFLCIECVAEEDVTHARLDQRTRTGTSVSDATGETYMAQKQNFEPVDELTAWQHIGLDTSGTLQNTLAEAREHLRERLQPAHFDVPDMQSGAGGARRL